MAAKYEQPWLKELVRMWRHKDHPAETALNVKAILQLVAANRLLNKAVLAPFTDVRGNG